jgi:predicted GNAT superfamily acetyltransferase
VSTVDEARWAAGSAASAAGVVIAEVASPGELDVLRVTMEGVWGAEIVPPRNLLRGMALSGACLLVASRDAQPVGFALGWLGWEGGVHFHSHQVGVSAGVRGGGVGLALKLAQRALCLEHDVAEMRWTFDPMLLANARFNLVRLGARVVAFMPHCYGDRRDAFNTGDTTDRVEVAWRLDVPVGGAAAMVHGDDRVISIPVDYQALRVADPGAAAAARVAVGAAFGELFATGGSVLGLGDDGYVVRSAAAR